MGMIDNMSSLPSLDRLLCELIAVRSVTTDREACGIALSICRNCFKDLPGVVIHDHEKDGQPSLVILSRNTLKPDVMIVCHVDVVPAPSSSFVPVVKGDQIVGRGAIDMKGPTCAMIRAFHRHVCAQSKTRDSSRGTVGLMLTTDEEVGGHRGVDYLMNEQGYRAKCALVPDAGYNFEMITLQYGIIRVRIRRKGKAAHSSRPEEGINAIDSFNSTYAEFKKQIAKIPETVSSLVKISGGIALNVVPDLCEATIDIRTARTADVLQLIKKTFEQKEYEIITNEPALRIDQKNPFIRQFKAVAENVLKRPVIAQELRGATDARYLSPFKIPVIITGPKGGGHHEDGEWVDLESLRKLEEITVRFLGEMR